MDELITLLPVGLDKNAEVLETLTAALDREKGWRRRDFDEWNYVEEISSEIITHRQFIEKNPRCIGPLVLQYLLTEWEEAASPEVQSFLDYIESAMNAYAKDELEITFWLDSDAYPFVLPSEWRCHSFQGYAYLGSLEDVRLSALVAWQDRLENLENDLRELQKSLVR